MSRFYILASVAALSTCFLQYLALADESCIKLDNCESCIQNPNCSWCSQPSFFGSDKKQLPRCNSPEDHLALEPYSCASRHLFTHVNQFSVVRDEPLRKASDLRKAIPIRPQRLHAKIRAKDPIKFELHYKEVEDYPLDLYYLMDGSYTMIDDQKMLVNLGDTLGQRLRNRTTKFRQGLGTFVDKMTSPFVSTIPTLLENPCSVVGDTCAKPYGFQHHLKLSHDTRTFSEAVKQVSLSASTDLPEGGFDALMQVMVCNHHIGWSEQARKMIIFATDANFHFAGDAALGGIILPNDGECHMDENGKFYTHSLIQDYPSISQINSKAKEHSISIIFAANKDEIRDYRILTNVIEGSKSAELAIDSSNIVDLVEKEYDILKSKVQMKDTFPAEYFEVKYFSTCNNDPVERENNTYEGLKEDAEVVFRIEIELIKCPPRKAEWKQQYRIYAVGLPDSVVIDLEMLCDCPCKGIGIPNSEICNYKGTLVCGLCECNENNFGERCECSSTGKRKEELFACQPDNSTEICSGRGTCECGQCNCINSKFSGRYCECDNSNCYLKDEELCAGHGTCDCGKCVCSPGWEGPGCDCSTAKDKCIKPGSTRECSGRGTCNCGSCQCNGWNSGLYCENCFHESCKECDKLKQCVQCEVFGTGPLGNPADCYVNCGEHKIYIDEFPDDIIPDFNQVKEMDCQVVDPTDECVMIFNYFQTEDGTFIIRAQKTKECKPAGPIFWIITVTAGIVVLVGLVLLCIFRVYQNILVKREFAEYEKERKTVVWGQETNPLYHNPVTTFENPMHLDKR